MNSFSAPVMALSERTVPSANWFTPSDTLTKVLLPRLWPCAPRACEYVGSGRSFRGHLRQFGTRSS
jgi:hypothetical protein